MVLIVTCSCNVSTEETSTKSNNDDITSPAEQTPTKSINGDSTSPSETTEIPTTTLPTGSETTVTPIIPLPTGVELLFETIIESGNIGGPYYKGESAQVAVVSSKPTIPTEVLDWVQPEYRHRILDVDYSTYIVVMAFNGFRIGIFSDFKIQKILRDSGAVYILAHFNDFISDATSLSSSSSQYQVVKIDRTQITYTGAITFRLFDELRQERASATFDFPE
jgi:hypothetical protein